VDAETLAREGYVVQSDSEWIVYAPDANVLLSPSFLGSHCFRMLRQEFEGEQRIGLAFEPLPGGELADVAGTLWLGEESSELRRLDLRYTNLPGEIDDDRLGGTVIFMPTPSGAWIIREWQLRMPIFSLRWTRGANVIRWGTALEGFSDTGGEVLSVRSPGGTIVYDAVLATVAGAASDTVSGQPVSGAGVFLPGAVDNVLTDARSPQLSNRAVLRHVRRDLEALYLDPDLRGLDWMALSQSAANRMDRAPGMSAAFEVVDELLDRLDDSHTFIIPPTWVRHLDYGFEVRFVGDTAFVTAVPSESDAEKVGVQVGDRMIAIGEDVLDRRSFGRTWYQHTVVNPRERFTVVVHRSDGHVRELPISPRVVVNPRTVTRTRGEDEFFLPWFRQNDRVWDYVELTTGVSVWRFGLFDPDDRDDVAEIFERAAEQRALILDLRENHGGVLAQLQYFLGFLFPEEVEIGLLADREGKRTLLASPQRHHVFRGELVVLVSSATGSTAEMLSSVVQRRGRGRVVGDRTAGAGMVSMVRWHRMNERDSHWNFGVSVSVAEFRTSDGGRLEGAGIVPDEYVLITRGELERREDPVLARALQYFGVDVDAAMAANVFSTSGPLER
jgi:C-terminal processing protease CtpA/Prc